MMSMPGPVNAPHRAGMDAIRRRDSPALRAAITREGDILDEQQRAVDEMGQSERSSRRSIGWPPGACCMTTSSAKLPASYGSSRNRPPSIVSAA